LKGEQFGQRTRTIAVCRKMPPSQSDFEQLIEFESDAVVNTA